MIPGQPSQKGFSLVELMIGMVLGLLIIAAVISVVVANFSTYRTTKAVNEMQENIRFAFEYIGRDIREAALIPCGSELNLVNVLTNIPSGADPALTETWHNNLALRGFGATGLTSGPSHVVNTGTNRTDRVAGTEVLRISGAAPEIYALASHDTAAQRFTVQESSHSINTGDIVLVCDYDSASIFRASATGTRTIDHAATTGSNFGNCVAQLGIPADCSSASSTLKQFSNNGLIARLRSHYWYLGCNGRADCSSPAGRSIFFARLNNGAQEYIELISSVDALNFEYRAALEQSFSTAPGVADWSNIEAVKVTLTLTQPNVGTSATAMPADIRRSYTISYAVRNRLL